MEMNLCQLDNLLSYRSLVFYILILLPVGDHCYVEYVWLSLRSEQQKMFGKRQLKKPSDYLGRLSIKNNIQARGKINLYKMANIVVGDLFGNLNRKKS